MVSATGVQSILISKVFNSIGSNISIEAYSSDVTDKWGDASITYSAGATTKAVPYNYIAKSLKWEAFSDIQQGDVAIVVPYTTTVTADDRITYDSKTWKIRELERFTMGDGTTELLLAIGLLLTEDL
jgi:head-tail adaptor